MAAAVLAAGASAAGSPDRARALVLGLGAGCGFGVVEVAVRLIDDPFDLTNPALYALLLGGGAAFLLLTSALSRGSVTTATAGMVIGETIGPALVGVAWLGDRTRDGLGWLTVTGFAVAVAGALALARFGEAPDAPEPPRTPRVYGTPCRTRGTGPAQPLGLRTGRGASTAAPCTARPAPPSTPSPAVSRTPPPTRPGPAGVRGGGIGRGPPGPGPARSAARMTERSVPGGSSTRACSPAAMPLTRTSGARSASAATNWSRRRR